MNFQFNIPSTNTDLLNAGGDSYYVKHVYDASEIPAQLKICRQAVLNQDAFYIFDHFDTYFSIIENIENVSVNTLLRSFDLLFMTSEKLERTLSSFLNDTTNTENVSERNSHLNLLKMSLFAFINTVNAIDDIICKAKDAQIKKTRKIDIDGFEGQNWEEKRYNFLIQLYNVIQLPLEKLWSPPVAEENFVNLFCNVCYKSLEMSYAKEKKVCDTIFQILGTAIKKYNHALVFPVRVLEILQTKKAENAISPISKGVYLLYEEFGIQTIFSVLVRDIVFNLKGDVSDTLTSKNIGTFLMELSTVAPKLIIPHLPILAEELLNCESYSLRNCILQIMGDVIINELTSEELSDELKETRDEFLEDLLNHMEDIHANVRSKVLQIWTHMKERNAVPLAFQHRVLNIAVERLDDKTIPVRKNAVILIKSFLENNPFAAKLTLAELIEKFENESKKIETLRDTMADELKKAVELDQQWGSVIPELTPILRETLKQDFDEIPLNSEENFENLVSKISTFLINKEYKEAIILVLQADDIAGNGQLRRQLEFEDLCVYVVALLKSYLFLSHGCKDVNEELTTQENALKFLEDSIKFSKIITAAVPKIQTMLTSRSNSDVFEAVDFFTTAYLFGIKGIETGMKNILYLVWSGDKEKRDAVINAYKKILFTTDQVGRAHAIKIVKNLSSFIENLNYGQYLAMEVLIKEWVESNDIDPQVIQVLFERFTMKLDDTTENESRLALQLLIATSSIKPSITTANIEVIEKITLSERCLKDPRIYTGCLSLLLNSIPSHLTSKFYVRHKSNDSIIEKITNLFKNFFFFPNINDFDSIVTKTIEFFYHLCQAPDIICQNLIIDIHKKLKEIIEKFQNQNNPLSSQQINDNEQQQQLLLDQLESQTAQLQIQTQLPISQQNTKIELNLPTFLLTRFIFLIGFVTMKEMIFLDIDVYNNMKFREELKEMKDNMKKRIHKRRTAHLDMSASESLKRLSGSAAEPQQEPDEDLVGAIAEDNIAELINYICEEELLQSTQGILHKIIPIVIEICKYPSKYNNEILQQSASLCLIRLMTVSSKFCEKFMPFVMNILQKNHNIKIKCNIIIGLSDLTFRFPNIIEPWTPHIFSTLYDQNDEIRLTAVKMISHLILNEMIRVKSQISDLAICIVDQNDNIKHITQQFFKELAKKSNILYNVLPDIISKLSDVNLNLEEGKYRIIMKYILSLIEKDRQIESLVEKLCLRFKITYEERQWRDIAYCLSLLNYSEKSLKKLIDNIQYFKDKIQCDEVYQSFKSIITNISKLAKPEIKSAIIELENRLNECLQVNDDDNDDNNGDNVNNNDNADKITSLRRGGNNIRNIPQIKKNLRPARGRKKQQNSSSESSSSSSLSSSSEEEEEERRRHTQRRIIKHKQVRKVQRIIEEAESSDNNSPVAKRGRSATINKRRK